MPLISVIMPVYNAESTLRSSVDSVLRQTFTDFELILINDGSTDASLDICRSYEAGNSKVKVLDQPNGGASSARNTGLTVASGEWIAFCDSDDYVDPQWLENFLENGLYGYSMVIQSIKADKPLNHRTDNRAEGHEKFRTVKIDSGEMAADRTIGFLRKNFILGYLFIKLYKTEIIRRNNLHFHSGITLQEDELFNLEYISMISGQKVFITEKAAYNYAGFDNKKYALMDYMSKTLTVLCKKYPSYNLEGKTYAIDRYFEIVVHSFKNTPDSKIKLLKGFHSFVKTTASDNVQTEYRLNKLCQRFLKIPGGVYIVYLILSLIRP